MNYRNTKIDCTDPTLKTHMVTVTCPQDILATGKISDSSESDENGAAQFEDLQLKVTL